MPTAPRRCRTPTARRAVLAALALSALAACGRKGDLELPPEEPAPAPAPAASPP